MTVQRKQIFAGLTIGVNLRDFDKLGEINQFIHEVADVFVDDEAKTLTVVKKESVPIDKDGLKKLIGVDGLDFAQTGAKGAAALERVAKLEQSLAAVTEERDQLRTKLKTAMSLLSDG